jgi:hypothetical protein
MITELEDCTDDSASEPCPPLDTGPIRVEDLSGKRAAFDE